MFTFLDLIYIFVISFNINNNKLAKSRKITIVTAADKSHYQSSIQLIKSILSTNNDVVVYFYDLEIETELDLGVLQDERIIYKKFPFEQYPKFFQRNILVNMTIAIS